MQWATGRGLAGGKQRGGEGQKERGERERPLPPHPTSHHHHHHHYYNYLHTHLNMHTQTLCIPPARAAHTTLPLFHTEAIINTCNNIFSASNSLLQIRTSHSCGVHSYAHGHPLACIHTHKISFSHTCHAMSILNVEAFFKERVCLVTKQQDQFTKWPLHMTTNI